MSRLVAIDTMVCIWGIKKEADRDNMISRCGHLLDYHQKRGDLIMIPAPVLGEMLAPVPLEKRAELSNLVANNFRVFAYDILATESFAEMMYQYLTDKSPESLTAYRIEARVPRQKVKVDYMIAAIAHAQKAECLYTDDEELRKFADKFIEVRSVPMRPPIISDKKIQPVQQALNLFELFEKPITPPPNT